MAELAGTLGTGVIQHETSNGGKLACLTNRGHSATRLECADQWHWRWQVGVGGRAGTVNLSSPWESPAGLQSAAPAGFP